MCFKNYFAAGARRAVLWRKGRADGRLTGAQFNKRVRTPFHERTMMNEVNGNTKRRAYNAFDSTVVRQELRGARRSTNYSQLASQNVLRQIKAEKRQQQGSRSSSRKFLPL